MRKPKALAKPSLRFIFIGIITSLFVTNVVFLRRTLSVLLCGVLSFNSTSCYSFLDNYGKADAATPSSSAVVAFKDFSVVQKDERKIAGCFLGVCVNLPKSPIPIPGVPSRDEKQLIPSANPQSNVSLPGKWQSDWGLVEFNSDLTGHWNQGSGIGQITDGNYDPKTRRLVFHYYQPWNKMNGTATLALSEDGNRLSGTWTQQRDSNPVGSGGSGGWTMTRDPSQQSVADARKSVDGRLTIVSLAGKWQSNWGLVEFNSDLSGRWNQGVGIGQIKDGTYDPQTRKLVFHYYQPWNEMDGTTTMMLSEDGNQLSGTWIQQRGSNPAGSGGSGGWVMTRNPSNEIGKAAEKEPLPEPGDIVLYPDGDGGYKHVAVIIEGGIKLNSDGTVTITKVRSKWGSDAVYDHDPNVTRSYGKIWTVWRRNKKSASCEAEKCNWLRTGGCNFFNSDEVTRKSGCYKTDKDRDISPGGHLNPVTEPPGTGLPPGVEMVKPQPPEDPSSYDCRGFVFGRRLNVINDYYNIFTRHQVQEILDDGYSQLHAKDTEGNMH